MCAFNPEGYQNTFQTALDGFLYKEITLLLITRLLLR